MFIVYEVWDLTSNQIFYVGKATNLIEREKQHIKAAKRNKNGSAFGKKLKSMIELGHPYIFRKVYESENEEDALIEEIRLIKYYGRRDLNTGSLLNLTDGGQGKSGWMPSAKTRKIWSEQRKGKSPAVKGKKYKHTIPSPKKGKSWTDLQRAEYESRSAEQLALKIKKKKETTLKNKESRNGLPTEKEKNRYKIMSQKMTGENNPMFGKPGHRTGIKGELHPSYGKTSPIKGKKLGPDNKMYTSIELFEKFGIIK